MKTAPRTSAVSRLALAALATSALLGVQSTQAAVRNWDGDTSATWATAGNWDAAPTNNLTSDIANFNLAIYGGNPVFAPNAVTTSIAGVSIGGSNGNMVLTTTALSIGSSGITVASGAGTVSIGAVKIGANQSWTNNSSSLLTLSSTVTNVGNVTPFTLMLDGSGTGGTTITGIVSNGGTTGTTALTVNTTAGSTILLANNTYTGATNISSGTLQIGNGGAAGKLAAASTITNNGVLIFNRSGTVTQGTDFSTAAITGSGQLVQNGTSTLTLNAANSYTGATTISGGTLSVGTTSNLGGAASNLVFDGGTLQITGTTLTNVSGIGHTVITNAGKTVGLDINNSGNIFTFDQVLNQTTGVLTKLVQAR